MVDLNTKELLCIARHIQELTERYWKNNSKYESACIDCQHVHTCQLKPWDHFSKLSDITAISITPRV